LTVRKGILTGLGGLAVAGFIFGVWELMRLRFETGDIYPPYSSLRTDPLGAKAYFHSLKQLPALEVSRNYLPLKKLAETKNATVFYLGVEPGFSYFAIEDENKLDEKDEQKKDSAGEKKDKKKKDKTKRKIEKNNKKKSGPCETCCASSDDSAKPLVEFVRKGGRLVFSLRPAGRGWCLSHELLSLALEFDFSLGVAQHSVSHGADGLKAGWDGWDDLPKVSWHSRLYFSELGPAWEKVLVCDHGPVLIERKFGKGSVVISTDSYFLSNEALVAERHPELLARLVGENRRIIFDETHLGVAEAPGIATLGRRYNLGGPLVVVLFLAGLFLWKNVPSFVPRDPTRIERLGGGSIAGKSSAEGLGCLLRKTIPARRLLSVCFKEWRRTAGANRIVRKTARAKIAGQAETIIRNEELKLPRKQMTVAAYRNICRILSERKK
jgi:hypothetical protein